MGVFSLWIYDIKEELKMLVDKLKEYEASVTSKILCGLYLKEGEKSRLYDICLKHEIPITYPSLFVDNKHYYLWGISKKGIGLIGTIIMRGLEENNGIIFQTLEQLEEYLKGE